eukprot:TRINITY_DN3067_c0_g1_i1.p1 TRINITY_DN3067_c0_g1~~TRINITY_DN3067_c0_g1_i1.p1  ORF type:complete len:787 (+),score=193.42 TRINITY_DN3067_c0_g1_i1:94-2454(+)
MCPSGGPASPLSVPTQWHWGRLLGKGSFGHVYLAAEAAHGDRGGCREGRRFAVKTFDLPADRSDSSDDACSQLLRAVLKEVEMARCIPRHPNVVRCYGCCFEPTGGGRLCIFTQYIHCGSLGALVRTRDRPLSEEETRPVIAQVCSGVAHLHRAGVYHRDLKGDNVLVSELSPRGRCPRRVALADFGASRRRTELQLGSMQQLAHTLAGTPLWMAPEVIAAAQGGGAYSPPRADVWSIGALTCECLTGFPPWPHFDNAWQALLTVGRWRGGDSGLELPPATPRAVTENCAIFLAACLRADPEARTPSRRLGDLAWLSGVDLSAAAGPPACRPLPAAEEALADVPTRGVPVCDVGTVLRLVGELSPSARAAGRRQADRNAPRDPSWLRTGSPLSASGSTMRSFPPHQRGSPRQAWAPRAGVLAEGRRDGRWCACRVERAPPAPRQSGEAAVVVWDDDGTDGQLGCGDLRELGASSDEEDGMRSASPSPRRSGALHAQLEAAREAEDAAADALFVVMMRDGGPGRSADGWQRRMAIKHPGLVADLQRHGLSVADVFASRPDVFATEPAGGGVRLRLRRATVSQSAPPMPAQSFAPLLAAAAECVRVPDAEDSLDPAATVPVSPPPRTPSPGQHKGKASPPTGAAVRTRPSLSLHHRRPPPVAVLSPSEQRLQQQAHSARGLAPQRSPPMPPAASATPPAATALPALDLPPLSEMQHLRGRASAAARTLRRQSSTSTSGGSGAPAQGSPAVVARGLRGPDGAQLSSPSWPSPTSTAPAAPSGVLRRSPS